MTTRGAAQLRRLGHKVVDTLFDVLQELREVINAA